MSTTSTQQPESYWKASDVARFLAVSAKWVYKHAELGDLPCSRFGANLRFDPRVIRAYAARCASKTSATVIPLHPQGSEKTPAGPDGADGIGDPT